MFQRNEMKNNLRHLSRYGHLSRYFQFVLSAIESRCPVHVDFKFTKIFIISQLPQCSTKLPILERFSLPMEFLIKFKNFTRLKF